MKCELKQGTGGEATEEENATTTLVRDQDLEAVEEVEDVEGLATHLTKDQAKVRPDQAPDTGTRRVTIDVKEKEVIQKRVRVKTKGPSPRKEKRRNKEVKRCMAGVIVGWVFRKLKGSR